jgi:transposase
MDTSNCTYKYSSNYSKKDICDLISQLKSLEVENCLSMEYTRVNENISDLFQEFTMSKKHKTYTTEFKAEAIKLIEANQGNVSETARQLSISMQTLSNWNTKAKAGTLAGTKQYSPDLNALLEENKKLKQQLKIAEMEREFLKKAAAYFAKESQ